MPWITDFSSVAATDPDQITGTIGRELAEMFTDPIASAWWCAASAFEIGDAEFSQGNTRQTARVNGVRVDAYWSNQDAATVIPVDRDYRARLRARVSPTASVELDSGTLRPTDREKTFCQIEDKDDAWRITGWDETATISVETGRFAQPRAHWVVAGQPVSGSGRLSVSVGVEQFVFVGPDIHPGAIYAQTNEVLEFVATDTTLTLTTDNAYANFDVTVEARVEETDFTGNVRTRQLQRVRRPRVRGSRLFIDPAYARAADSCQLHLKDLFGLVDGPVTPHPGDPVFAIPAYAGVERAVRVQNLLQWAVAAERTASQETAPEAIDGLLGRDPLAAQLWRQARG